MEQKLLSDHLPILATANVLFQDMLPEYTPIHMAESILFAGKAIRVLRNTISAFRSVDATHTKLMGDEVLT
ncbi:hypothetical protein Lser_V15G05509 [Lactuca serriola]